RSGHRRARARRDRRGDARPRQAGRAAAIGLCLPLRLRHADRRRAADQLVSLAGQVRIMSDWPILSVVTFLPLVGALLILVLRGEQEAVARNARYLALWTSLLTFLISLILWFRFDRASADFQFVETAEWIPAYNIRYHMGVDGISMLFVLLST